MTCLVAIGSNLHKGPQTPFDILSHALWMFEGKGLHVVARSRWYRSSAYPSGNGPDFINAVVQVETDLAPAEILEALHSIEAALGRVRRTRWEARVVDLDLLAVGGSVLPDAETVTRWIELHESAQSESAPEELLLPHPRLQDRAFVLAPMHDIAPDWRHPVLARSVAEMLEGLDEETRASVTPIASPQGAATAPV